MRRVLYVLGGYLAGVRLRLWYRRNSAQEAINAAKHEVRDAQRQTARVTATTLRADWVKRRTDVFIADVERSWRTR